MNSGQGTVLIVTTNDRSGFRFGPYFQVSVLRSSRRAGAKRLWHWSEQLNSTPSYSTSICLAWAESRSAVSCARALPSFQSSC